MAGLMSTLEKAANRATKKPTGWGRKGNIHTKNGIQQHKNDEMTMAVVLNGRPSSRQKMVISCCCIALSRR